MQMPKELLYQKGKFLMDHFFFAPAMLKSPILTFSQTPLLKYCECYNAGVKCSGSCRCVGCKNLPPGGFGGDPGDSAIAPRSFAADIHRINALAENVVTLPPNSEHKMRDAATHLVRA